jgi:hypothetical protein
VVSVALPSPSPLPTPSLEERQGNLEHIEAIAAQPRPSAPSAPAPIARPLQIVPPQSDAADEPAATALRREPIEVQPLPSEVAPAPPPHTEAPVVASLPRELPPGGDEPVRTPESPGRTIVVRETVRTPVEAPPKPSDAPARAPRTAEGTSVIGALGRSDATRARLELWLR